LRYLLDTCVISELASKRPQREVVLWVDELGPDDAYLSVVTIGEVRKGIEKVREPEKRDRLMAWLQSEVLPRFGKNLIALDLPVLLEWGRLVGRLETLGSPMPAMDSLIAAAALHHDLVLATRNVSDFQATGVKLVNPWLS
jgi:toxin FitB